MVGVTDDEEMIRQEISILSQELLMQFYGKQVTITRLMADTLIAPSRVDQEGYCPTVTGVLFFTDEPQQFLPEATVICSRFQGDLGRDIIQTEELCGPLGQLSETSLRLVVRWLTRNYQLKGARLQGQLPIPKEALREAIVNALIHRKYSIPGAVKIALYDNHLEIFSPGSLPGLVDLEHLGDGTTYLRNPHIARIAHRMGLVEKLGSGVRLIFDSCKQAGLRKPEYQEGADSVKVTFFFKPDISPNAEEAILHLAHEQQVVSIREVMSLLSVSRNTATRKLNALLCQGRLIRTGRGPTVRYQLPTL